MTDDELAAIEARASAATPNWYRHDDDPQCIWAGGGDPDADAFIATTMDEYKADADFIFYARTDIPALIAEVRKGRERERMLIEEARILTETLGMLTDEEKSP